jgi:uncharacterized protein YbjT (DUF2867 family)
MALADADLDSLRTVITNTLAQEPGPAVNKELVLAGSSNQIAAFLIPMLLRDGWRLTAISRQSCPAGLANAENLKWMQLDLSTESVPRLVAETLVYVAPLDWFNKLAVEMPNLRRAIAFSSTSRFSKEGSADRREQETASMLARGEQQLITHCQKQKISWTVLRPTLIYGAGLDQSLTRLARWIERWRFLPLPGQGSGQRQPVHAEDLAKAVTQLLAGSAGDNNCYSLSGGETLTYREMVRRIFVSLDLKPRVISLPLLILNLSLVFLRLWPAYRDLGPEMLNRINRDLVFDCDQAQKDFGYQPRRFAPQSEDWIPFHRR